MRKGKVRLTLGSSLRYNAVNHFLVEQTDQVHRVTDQFVHTSMHNVQFSVKEECLFEFVILDEFSADIVKGLVFVGH